MSLLVESIVPVDGLPIFGVSIQVRAAFCDEYGHTENWDPSNITVFGMFHMYDRLNEKNNINGLLWFIDSWKCLSEGSAWVQVIFVVDLDKADKIVQSCPFTLNKMATDR